MTAASSGAASDALPIVRDGSNYKLTLSALAQYAANSDVIQSVISNAITSALSDYIQNAFETVTNWNTSYNSEKPIRFLYGWNVANAPETSAHILCLELNISQQQRIQFAFRSNTATKNAVWMRSCTGGTWRAWGKFTVADS